MVFIETNRPCVAANGIKEINSRTKMGCHLGEVQSNGKEMKFSRSFDYYIFFVTAKRFGHPMGIKGL